MELCIQLLIRMAIVQILVATDFDTGSIIQFVAHTYPMTKIMMIDLPCNTSQQQKWSGLKNTSKQTFVMIYPGTQLLISTAIQIMLANTSKTLVHLNSSRILCNFGDGPVNAATYTLLELRDMEKVCMID
jgi:hypothetical protein